MVCKPPRYNAISKFPLLYFPYADSLTFNAAIKKKKKNSGDELLLKGYENSKKRGYKVV